MRYAHTEAWTAPEPFTGVTATIRRLSFGQRLRLSETVDPLLQQLGEIVTKPSPTAETTGVLEQTDQAKAGRLLAQIQQAYVKAGLVRLTGLEYAEGELPGGVDATGAEALIEYGPPELVEQIGDAIQRLAGLTGDQSKNLSAPSISATTEAATRPVPGSAPVANAPETTGAGIA